MRRPKRKHADDELSQAISAADLEQVCSLLKTTARDIDQLLEPHGHAPLEWAMYTYRDLKRRADVSNVAARKVLGLPDLHERVLPSYRVIWGLLALGARGDVGGYATPLYDAAAGDDQCLFEAVLSASSSFDHGTVSGVTPLMSAVYSGHLGRVQALLARGANPNAMEEFGKSVLTLALRKWPAAHPIICTLVAAGAK